MITPMDIHNKTFSRGLTRWALYQERGRDTFS